MKKKICFVFVIACILVLGLCTTSCATQRDASCNLSPQSYDFSNIKPSKQTPIKTNYKPRYK